MAQPKLGCWLDDAVAGFSRDFVERIFESRQSPGRHSSILPSSSRTPDGRGSRRPPGYVASRRLWVLPVLLGLVPYLSLVQGGFSEDEAKRWRKTVPRRSPVTNAPRALSPPARDFVYIPRCPRSCVRHRNGD